jgi:Domain of unknown function (DUF4347)/Calx-beta domain/FG-GAP-like repeat/Bacterial Ig domain
MIPLNMNLTPSTQLPLSSEVLSVVSPSPLALTPRDPSGSSASLLFIDSRVEEYQTLVAGAAPGTEVHRLDGTQDAISQITQTLLGRAGIASIQIVSHGQGGGLLLGESWVTGNDLDRHAPELQSWAQALTADADILLYGCNVAQGELGKAFVSILGQLTGADIAASDNLTGNAALNGDWILEYHTGSIEATTLNSAALANYRGVLTTYTNPNAIINSGNLAASTPYPSVINVSGFSGTVGQIKVTLSNFSYAYPGDIDILLVGPDGKNLILMSDAGRGNSTANQTLTFTDSGAALTSGPIISGTYKPTNINDSDGDDVFPNPAPVPSVATTLAIFNGTDPNGDWSLYVRDDFGGGEFGSIAGWSLDITPPNVAPSSSNSSITLTEDTPYTFATTDFPFTDSDSGDTLQSVQITQLPPPNTGSLTLNGNAVNVNDTIGLADITNGNLQFIPFANAHGINYSSFQFKVNDGKDFSTSAYTLSLNVTAQDDPTFFVTNTNDSGLGSLRQAILDANADAGTEKITFSGAIFTDTLADTIALTSGQLRINSSILLQGTGANLLTLSGNNASRVFNISSGTVSISGVTIANAVTTTNGAGILNAGNLTISDSRITNNIANGTSTDGGGIYNTGTLALINSTVSNNRSGDDGGGIRNDGTLTINNSTVSNNVALSASSITSGGGGLLNTIGHTANVTNSTFSGNTALIGGAIRNDGALTLLSSTINANTATGNVGGVGNSFNPVTLAAIGQTTLKNSVIAGNFDSTPTPYNLPDVGGGTNSFTDQGHNLIGISDGLLSPIDPTTLTGTVTNPLNPLLAPLGNNGGSTQTHALLPGSAAINAGTSTGAPANDQRGISRVGSVDIGAFESRGFTLTATSGTPQSGDRNRAFSNPLVATISSAFGETIDGGVITFTAPGSGASTANPTQTATIVAGQASITPTANSTVGSYPVTASATGSVATIDFNLTNINVLPTLTPVSKPGSEDTLVNFSSSDFTSQFNDGNGDTLVKIQINSLPTQGILKLSGADVTLGQEITIAELSNLTYSPNANANGNDSFAWNGFDGLAYATTSATVNLTIVAVNDAPLNTVPGSQTVNENAELTITGISVNDVDGNLATTQLTVTNGILNVDLAGGATISTGANSSATLTLSGTQTQINAALATLKYQGALNFSGTDILTVLSTDSDGNPLTDSDTVAIAVNSVNHVPLNTIPGAQTVNEDTELAITGISVADVDGNLATTQLTVTNGTLNVNLTGGATISSGANSSATLTLSGTQTQINAALATLKYQGALNFSGTDTLTVLSTDSDGTPLTDLDTVAIVINGVNRAPLNTIPGAQTVNEDTELAITGISVNDVDGNLATTQLTVTNGILNINLTGGATISTGANNSATLTLSGTQTQINAALATLKYQGVLNFNGSDTLTVLSTDSDGNPLTDLDTIAIAINSVNDAPSFTATNPVAVNEDAGAQTLTNWATFNPGPTETGQTATYTVSNISNAALFTVAPSIAADGTLTYTAAANANGTATFEVVVQDNGGTANGGQNTSTLQTFTITVNSVNDAPSFTATNPVAVNEDAGAQTLTNWAAFNPGPNETGQTATYTVSNISNAALFAVVPTIAANGTLTYTAAANANGTATFDVVVQDNGGTTNGGVNTSTLQTFTLTVNSVNDAPSFTKGADQTVTAGDTLQTIPQWATGLSLGPTNESGQTVTYQIVSNSHASLFEVAPTIDPTGTLTYQPISNLNTSTTVTLGVVVQDNGGTANSGIDTSIPQTFTITINPQPTLTIADSRFSEGNSGTPQKAITVQLDRASSQTIVVDFTTANGNATIADSDYVATSGTLVFAPGETEKTISVNFSGDLKIESDEFFTIQLSNASNVTLATQSANVVIANDDQDNESIRQMDFTGDGTADILWRNQTTGEIAIWSMNSSTVIATYSLPTLDPDWQIETVADFDGNGQGDILWRNYATQEMAIWRMDGTAIAAGGYLPSLDFAWEIAGSGDFNGDGKADLVLRNRSTGENAVWTIEDVTLTSGYMLLPIADLNWQVAGVGDFNGDGTVDLLWRNDVTDQTALWQLDGAALVRGDLLSTTAASWAIQSTGDLNGDGTADLVWRNDSTGEMAVWLMKGSSVTAGAYLSPVADLNWKIVGAGDFDQDGKADLLWRNYASGENAIWSMDGIDVKVTGLVGPLNDFNWNIGGMGDSSPG